MFWRCIRLDFATCYYDCNLGVFMRRMSGGGGPGGQIFNIGKSKATLFDKTKVKSFKDVAG